MRKYGTDKPDLRNPIEMQDVTEHFRGSGFKVFAGMIEQDPKVRVWAIPAPKGGSRAFCDRMNKWAIEEHKQRGLGYIMWRPEEGPAGAGPIAKNIGAERAGAIFKQTGLAIGDACFFVAGDPADFYKFAGLARDEVGRELKLVDEGRFALPGSSISPSTSGTRRRRRSTSRTTRSRCPRAAARRWKRPRRRAGMPCWRSRPTSTTWCATATRSHPDRSATTSPTRW
jgi:hypothetical protein